MFLLEWVVDFSFCKNNSISYHCPTARNGHYSIVCLGDEERDHRAFSVHPCHKTLLLPLLPILISTQLPICSMSCFLHLPNVRMLTCLQPLLCPAASSLLKNTFLRQDLIQREGFELNSHILSKPRFISRKVLSYHARKYKCLLSERERQTSRPLDDRGTWSLGLLLWQMKPLSTDSLNVIKCELIAYTWT